MMMKLFSVRDVVSNTYGTPFSSVNTDTAVRSLRMEASDPNSVIGRNLDDFELYSLGEFDQDTGLFVDLSPAPVLVLRCSVFRTDAISEANRVGTVSPVSYQE